jgi:hypothetical protein
MKAAVEAATFGQFLAETPRKPVAPGRASRRNAGSVFRLRSNRFSAVRALPCTAVSVPPVLNVTTRENSEIGKGLSKT